MMMLYHIIIMSSWRVFLSTAANTSQRQAPAHKVQKRVVALVDYWWKQRIQIDFNDAIM
jgi:hypothetical protein